MSKKVKKVYGGGVLFAESPVEIVSEPEAVEEVVEEDEEVVEKKAEFTVEELDEEIDGLGEELSQLFVDKFGDGETVPHKTLRNLSIEELKKLPGIGKAKSKKLKEQFEEY